MCADFREGLFCDTAFLQTNCLLAWEKGQSVAEHHPAPTEMVFLAETVIFSPSTYF